MFKTYNASAGSGKTTNLVAEYLYICLQAPEKYRHVLAITFTNNATAEMKDRIIRTLNDFAFTDPAVWDSWEKQPAELRKQLEKSFFIHQTTRELSEQYKGSSHEILDSHSIHEKSEKLLENILSHYPDFAISTIDSFFQRIVRSFAFDLGLSLDFNLEVSLDDYFQQTIDLLYQRISGKSAEGKNLAHRVLDLMEQRMEESGQWRIDNDLLTLLKDIYDDEQAASYTSLLSETDFPEAWGTLSNTWKVNKEMMEELVKKGLKLLKDSGIPETDFPQYGILDWFNHVCATSYKKYVKLEKNIHEGGSFTKKGCNDLSPADRDEIIKTKQDIEKLIDDTLLPCALIRKDFKRIQLLFDLQKIMNELRAQDNKFFLSETGQLIQKEVKDNPVPYIYSKVGSRFSNYFIDEFQDTSDLQWENLLPLLDEAVSGNDSDGRAILFGDVKQAIYRFRNGNPQLFAELVNPDSPSRKHFKRLTRCEEKKLDANHRTCHRIIDFNNAFFTQLPMFSSFPKRLANYKTDFYADFYSAVEQKTFKSADGFVAIKFREEETDIDNSEKEYLANNTVNAIKDALHRGFQLRNIAVLTRTIKAGRYIGGILADNGIAVISADSLVLKSSDEVNLIIAMMRHITSPADALTRFHLLHLLLKKEGKSNKLASFMDTIAGTRPEYHELKKEMPEEERWAIIKQNKAIEREALRQSEKDFKKLIEKEFGIELRYSEWVNQPLLTLVHTLIRTLGLQTANSYIVGLIDLVNEYTTSHNDSMDTFLEWWDQKGANKAITSPENIDAVRIMTIHKSKGKEFPVVIMPVLDTYMSPLTKQKEWKELNADKFGLPATLLRKSEDTDQALGTDHYAEECALTALDETNILYVGQTRPEEALYLIVDRPRSKRPNPKSNGAANYLNYSLLLEDFTKMAEKEFTKENGWFWYGDRNHTSLKPHSTKENDDTAAPAFPISDFSQAQLIPAETESEKQEIGIAVHSYFENATRFPQTEEEAERWTFEEGQPYQEEIRAALKSLTRNKALLPYFADGLTVLKEVSILTMTGERRRPDRVVQKDGETVVIDFKTGEPTEKMKEAYRNQVEEYVQLLQSMGYQKVRGELLYL